MSDESIFICDPPLGIQHIIKFDHLVSKHEVERLITWIDEWIRNPNVPVIVLNAGLEVEFVPNGYEWPDAEFCAA